MISEKIWTINDKKQNDLDWQTAEDSVISSRNITKYQFLTGEDVLPEKDLSEKAATIKRFEYSPLGNELTKQTSIEKE